MLILNRKKGQSIIIDGNIRVTYLGRRGSYIRLGITAPDVVSVNREEVHIRNMEEDERESRNGEGG